MYVFNSRPWVAQKSREQEIIVTNLVDLNEISNAETPLAVFETRMNRDAILPYGFITGKLNAIYCGFVPGQVIPFSIEAVNETGKDVIDINFQLVKKTKYTASRPEKETKMTDDVIRNISLGPMKNHESKLLNIAIQIPILPPSGLHSCELIDIEYWIKVIFRMINGWDNFTLVEHVVIGNLPMSKVDAALQGLRFV